MADESKHFLAYHNTERMGRSLAAGDPFKVVTNKSVGRLHGHFVWIVVGEGSNPRRYSLGSVFRVTETGDAAQDGFRHFAAGRGHVFDPPVPLHEREWFDGFRIASNRFQFGVQLISDASHVAALSELARQAGATLP